VQLYANGQLIREEANYADRRNPANCRASMAGELEVAPTNP